MVNATIQDSPLKGIARATSSSMHWTASDGLDVAYLGGALPATAELHLRLAGACYDQDETALKHLEAARSAAPEHPAVLIGFYRFYFYKNRLQDALTMAQECLLRAAADNNFAGDWRRVQPGDAQFNRMDAVLPRFFLFSLKGYAYLQMRLGNLFEGRAALDKLLELDPEDRLGGKVLVNVLERYLRGDDD